MQPSAKLASVLLALLSTSAFGITYTTPWYNQSQIHSNWCWNASVRNLIYTESAGSKNVAQCDVANYAFGINYACNYNAGPFAGSSAYDHGNWLNCADKGQSYCDKDDRAVLSHWGYSYTSYITYAPSFATLKASIDRNHGMLTDWRWNTSGGHIILANGYDVQAGNGSQWVALFNPWPGEGQEWKTYATYVGGSSPTYDHTTVEVVAVK